MPATPKHAKRADAGLQNFMHWCINLVKLKLEIYWKFLYMYMSFCFVDQWWENKPKEAFHVIMSCTRDNSI